jgi:hypothetical protein
MYGGDWGSSPVVGLGICGLEHTGSVTRELASLMGLRKLGCEDGRWMELAQDGVQRKALILSVLNLRPLPLKC